MKDLKSSKISSILLLITAKFSWVFVWSLKTLVRISLRSDSIREMVLAMNHPSAAMRVVMTVVAISSLKTPVLCAL